MRSLIELAERAPYGKGADTLVDTSVRNCFQIDADQILVTGNACADTFSHILGAAAWQVMIRRTVGSVLGVIAEPGDGKLKELKAQAVRDLFVLAWRAGLTGDAAAAARTIVALPDLAAPERILPAALRELHGEGRLAHAVPFAILWGQAVRRLLERSRTPPEEPGHWKIVDAHLSCSCEHCARLLAFCDDPAAQVARFPLRQDLRTHLHGVIERHNLDMDHVTERKGRPYTLVCTKNRASFLRRLKEYKDDVSWMRRLIGCAPGEDMQADCAPQLAGLQEAVAAAPLT